MRRSTDEPVDEATQNLLLAARAPGLGACLTSWASYGGEPLRRDAAGVPPATRGWNQPDVEDP